MKSEIEADIKFLKQMAEQGQKSPLQGGEHGVLWGGMFTVSALFAYAVVAQIIALPSWTIALAFIGPHPLACWLGNISIKSTAAARVASALATKPPQLHGVRWVSLLVPYIYLCSRRRLWVSCH